jgi:hypothetical protein
MTETTLIDLLEPDDPPPARSGLPWSDEDFEGVMRGCREGLRLEQIAVRIGRAPGSLRAQLKRLLPADERHLPVDLALPRLRQLNADGDYDWLAAMAWQPVPPWTPPPAPHLRPGLAGMPDDQLVSLVASLAVSHFSVHPWLQQQIATEMRTRHLEGETAIRVHESVDYALADLLAGSVHPVDDGRYDDPHPWPLVHLHQPSPGSF